MIPDKPSEYDPHLYRVPTETPVAPGATAFMTTDRRVYTRSTATMEIHRALPKVRGKAARRADKVQRRQIKRAFYGSITTPTFSPPKI
jgi:hypothetical protein